MQLQTKRREKLCNGEEEIVDTIIPENFPFGENITLQFQKFQ